MDRFGRKLIIAIKAMMSLVFLLPLLVMGFISHTKSSAIIFMFFFSLLFASFSFDLYILGFESLPREKRPNYIIMLQLTKVIGVVILILSFYFTNKWVYFIIFELASIMILLVLYIKYSFDSPHWKLVSDSNTDKCKHILD